MSGADRLISGLEMYGTAGFIPPQKCANWVNSRRVIDSDGLVHDLLRASVLTALRSLLITLSNGTRMAADKSKKLSCLLELSTSRDWVYI